MSFDILNRWTRTVMYHSEAAIDVSAAVKEAHLEGAHLEGANLRGADLGGANLEGVDLRSANLRSANLGGAYLEDAEGITPKVLQIFGSRHVVVVREYGMVTIGCHHKELAWWEEHYASVGRSEGYTPDAAAEYGDHIAACRKFMERYSLLAVPAKATV